MAKLLKKWLRIYLINIERLARPWLMQNGHFFEKTKSKQKRKQAE